MFFVMAVHMLSFYHCYVFFSSLEDRYVYVVTSVVSSMVALVYLILLITALILSTVLIAKVWRLCRVRSSSHVELETGTPHVELEGDTPHVELDGGTPHVELEGGAPQDNVVYYDAVVDVVNIPQRDDTAKDNIVTEQNVSYITFQAHVNTSRTNIM